MQLKRSFIAANLSSWRAGTDCCHWEGVTCDMVSGKVISLDLSELNLRSHRLDPALFDLTSLRYLNLASNYFIGVGLPESGFERLTDLLHLNFSNNGVTGHIPLEIARLKKLVTLDFSDNTELYFLEPSFQTILSNLSNLRELRLDSVDIRSGGSNWSVVLAHNVPKLEILSLSWCGISGKVPELFAELSSLSILDLSGNDFEGQFPTKIFQLKSLRTLDVYYNPSLSVNLPDFPDGNSLETLNLAWTNLSYHMPSSFVNLKSLKSLCISTATSKELPSLIGELPSLTELQLFGSYSGWEKPVLSWVGNLMQLTDLTLDQYDFSQLAPSWIGNLTNLARLEIWNSNMSMPIPNQIGNLAKLTSLEFLGSDFFGQQIPLWIGNLTKLTSLRIFECGFSGSIPSTIGNLTQLEELQIIFNMELNDKYILTKHNKCDELRLQSRMYND
ncbi:hypothetical protein GUJ93_ZPchr0001g30379 [Zizania palustris]|uniref:Leucine-rich repeat-containing N-terminal plant-type domain-containing protein n=1 Tax=Zizania palustris TaxID=103762 RepID=A0A8J5S1T8_ZIZPA|nr:hypothetical protein GUJ93_ZPchr0001g30379 [Zizania palustris]